MYTCNECDFESEIKVTQTGQHLFTRGLCRTCYYREWRTIQPESNFNTTVSEETFYTDTGYNMDRVQSILQRPWH